MSASKIILFVLLVCILAVKTVEMSAPTEIPEKFLGKWKLDKSENFDEYLETKGLNWFLRKLIGLSSVTYVFKKGSEPGKYTSIAMAKKTIEYKDFKLGEMFEGEGMDGSKHKITFTMADENTLDEHHDRYQIEGDNQELYHYTREGNFLVQTMSNKGVTAKRWHKLVQEKK